MDAPKEGKSTNGRRVSNTVEPRQARSILAQVYSYILSDCWGCTKPEGKQDERTPAR